MKKMFFLLFIVSLVFFINSVIAQDIDPDKYSIQKGDTLWDITDTKFNDSFLWPYLWEANPQIKNPDRIFPGDMIRIPSIEELMRLQDVTEEKSVAEPVIEEKPEIVMPPRKPRYIVDRNLLLSSGWITKDFPGIGEIFASPDKRTIFGDNDLVYLESDSELNIGDRFFVIRAIKKVKHPKTKKALGTQIRIMGILEVIGMDGENNNVPKAEITSSFEDIEIGDNLVPYTEKMPPVVQNMVRTPDVKGYIVESHMNLMMVSTGDIVYLDKGDEDGLAIGDTFSALYNIPVQRSIGKIQIIALQPTTSSAIILQSEQDINIGDMWGQK